MSIIYWKKTILNADLTRPKSIRWIVILVGIMTIRLIIVKSIPVLGSDAVPISWIIPLIGDIFIGSTAIVLAYLIWKRRGVYLWAATMVWTAIGIVDIIGALILEQVDPRIIAQGGPSNPTIILAVLMILQLIGIILMNQPQVVLYFCTTDD